jgi:NAD(P)-dependent dehydrogenase (short-subunit alcohol dehydrogenase family)
MKKAGNGSLINIAPIAGPEIGIPAAVGYCPSKGALAGMSKA